MDGKRKKLTLRDYAGLFLMMVGTSIALIGTELITDKRLQAELMDKFKKRREQYIQKHSTPKTGERYDG
jgi:hypothetical protein